MALQLMNGNRSDVREFVVNHETPAKLVLAIVRHLVREDSTDDGDALLAVVNVQSLLEMVDV